MLKPRVIPCLLLADGGLTKTVKFKNGKYIGDPINAVRIFNEKEVDELIFIDIEASRNNQAPNVDLIKDLASECFMPFSYGGGVSNLKEIERILKIGVEKVVLTSKTLHQLSFIKDAAKMFGSSTIIAGMDVSRNLLGKYRVYNHITRKNTDKEPLTYAKEIEDAGAGEIFLNDVDREGTFQGFDIQLIHKVAAGISIPLIACGGAKSIDDFNAAIKAGASAVAAGSLFVYQGPHRAVLISYPSKAELKQIYTI